MQTHLALSSFRALVMGTEFNLRHVCMANVQFIREQIKNVSTIAYQSMFKLLPISCLDWNGWIVAYVLYVDSNDSAFNVQTFGQDRSTTCQVHY